MSAVLVMLCKYFKPFLKGMKYHYASHTKNTGSGSYFVPFQIPQFAFSETEMKPQPKFS